MYNQTKPSIPKGGVYDLHGPISKSSLSSNIRVYQWLSVDSMHVYVYTLYLPATTTTTTDQWSAYCLDLID